MSLKKSYIIISQKVRYCDINEGKHTARETVEKIKRADLIEKDILLYRSVHVLSKIAAKFLARLRYIRIVMFVKTMIHMENR